MRKQRYVGDILYSTASQRLRKNILFACLVKLKENVCYVCNELINTPNELSIEHKLPWENRDDNLFWDLTNIAFSHHQKCNRPHVYRGASIKYNYKNGRKYCPKCYNYFETSMFPSDPNSYDKLKVICKNCFSIQRKSYPSRRKMSDTNLDLNKARTDTDPLKYRKEVKAELSSKQFEKAVETTEREQAKK